MCPRIEHPMATERTAVPSEVRRADSEVLDNVAVGWLVLASPVLILPELVWPEGRWVAAIVGMASMVLAIRLVVGLGWFPYFVGVLALSIAAGWARVAHQENALAHFTGVAVGLLTMGTIAAWCRTQQRLAVACSVFLLIGLAIVTIGIQSTSVPSPTKYLSTEYLPRTPMALPGLEAGGLINPNALGATALMILPVAVSVLFLAGRRFRGQLAVRLLALVTAFCTGAVALVTQSRSVWMAAWLITLVAAVRLGRPGKLRGFAILLVLAVPTGAILWVSRQLAPDIVGVADRIVVRSQVWRQAVDTLSTSPWLGIGLNEFRHVYDRLGSDFGSVPHAHNVFLQTALDGGLIGLAGYVGVVAWLVLTADATAHAPGPSTLARYVAGGAGLSIIGVHVFGLADAVALGAKVGLFQWICAGMIIAAWRIQRSNHG
jgi:putative inorganic carbon (HCO3(-)) transporter